jgi:putative membrane protein
LEVVMASRRRCVAGIAVVLVTGVAGVASAKIAEPDRTFLDQAYSLNLSEADLGALARDRATTPELSEYGMRMSRYHVDANLKLRDVAAREHLPLDAVLLDPDVRSYKRMSSLHGPAFDAAYADHLVTGRDQAMALFEREARAGHNRQLRQYAAAQLQTLRARAPEPR